MTQQLIDFLVAENMNYCVFDDVIPDPVVSLIDEGVRQYIQQNCDSVIALGGGSVMDCAKAIAACVVKGKKIHSLAGLFRVRQSLPPFIAIPTTAGTGSEATLVAVVTDPVKKQKFTVIDPCLVPKYAIIDPSLMIGLPPKITAETGIDALTHAIESYIGLHSTPETKKYCLDAISRIFQYLPRAYENGEDTEARNEMSIASYYAGVAFTRTSIGYVHAIAHQLGGYYHIPHGLANAVLLPHVLLFSFDKAYVKYAEIAYSVGIANSSDTVNVAAEKLIDAVNSLNSTLNIPQKFTEINFDDIPLLATRAVKEAYCDYPVPQLMSVNECKEMLNKLAVKT